MREYNLRTYKEIDWSVVDKAPIDTFKWTAGGYTPHCFAQCALLENVGLCVKLTANEKNPRAVHENFNDPVCTDSCLEFFAAFEEGSDQYVNFEFNSKGTCLATLRGPRGPVVTIDNIISVPKIKAEVFEEYWTVEFLLSFADIKALFPKANIEKGASFHANFYKCGDETEIPHYGMWNEVMCDPPNFHAPQFFGKINIC